MGVGFELCSPDIARNRSQPSATGRDRSREGRMAVPTVSSAKGIIFGVFQLRIASFRAADVAPRDIPTCFTFQTSVCVAGAMLWLRFQKMRCIFHGRCSTLDNSDVILLGMRSTFNVLCCVFSGIAMSALREVVTRCKFRSRRGIL